jgi:helix-turn-helix, Psq domain
VRRPTKRDASLLVFTTIATPLSRLALHKEGRLKLAVQAYKEGHFSSYTTAANAYDVVRSTLQRRIASTPAQLGSTLKSRLLTPTEEESLL